MSQKLPIIAALFAFALPMNAQQPVQKAMGSIATADASVSGGLEVSGPRARLISNASVTANDRTAQIDLDRGGLVQVCATSAFHLLRSGTGDALLFALDRGAIEIRTVSRAQDAILTPDLRFTMLTAGPLDLRMRVTREGDTCVENRGDTAPVLQIRESFGDATYHLAPSQHVLFEHGSLHEVVDRERSDCGCPAATPAMIAASATNATSVITPQQVAALNPFPAAQSADLSTAPTVVPIVAAGNAASATLSFDGPATAPPSQPVKPASPPTQRTPAIVAALSVASVPPPMPPGAHDIFHAIGHFFHRLFHGHAQASPASR